MTGLFEEYSEIIPGFSLFQESLQRPIPTHLRINRLLIEPATLVHLLEEKIATAEFTSGICSSSIKSL
jgi:hypothetical protein